MFKNMKYTLSVFLVLAVFVSLAYADIRATLGGKNSSGSYSYTVDNTGLLRGGLGSTTEVVTGTEIVSTGTMQIMDSDDNGKTFIITVSGTVDITLPDCGTTAMEMTFIDATTNATIIDTASTEDTIEFLTLDAGDAIDSSGTVGDGIRLNCYTEHTWIPTMINGVWTDGGAN